MSKIGAGLGRIRLGGQAMWLLKIISAIGWTIISLWLTANWWEIILLSLGAISIVLTVAAYLILIGCRDKDFRPPITKRLMLIPLIFCRIFIQIVCQLFATLLVITAVVTAKILRIPMADES